MQKQIILQNKKVSYTLRKSHRARRMRLAVYCDGSVVVTTPFDLKESVAEKFIREKAQWLFTKISFFAQFKNKPITKYNKSEYLKYRGEALLLAQEQVEYFNNKYYGYKCNKINIKNQKTRWGSCSKKGNLNFNYKILFLPKRVRDYIIVHEICHLKEFNHSKKFWNLIGKTFPEHTKIKQDLKSNGLNFF